MNVNVYHLIGGGMIIAALSLLAAIGTITGVDALGGILPIAGVLVGTTATSVGAQSAATVIPPPPQPVPEVTVGNLGSPIP